MSFIRGCRRSRRKNGYNAEAENCVRYVKAGNLAAAEKRLTDAANAIARYASMMEMRISPAYHELRLRQLALTADYQMKVGSCDVVVGV